MIDLLLLIVTYYCRHHPSSPAKWNFFLSHSKTFARKILKAPCDSIYLTRTGSRSSQPNKCLGLVVVPSDYESQTQVSHRYGFTAKNTDQYQQDYPTDFLGKKSLEIQLLYPLLKDLTMLVDELKTKMGEPITPEGKRRSVIVMVANEGVMDLLLNFICSAEGIGIDLRSVIVFVGTEEIIGLVEAMGVQAMYNPRLGSMPAHAAASYMDDTFGRMMWFKTTSVYLALAAGYNVMFQDVDLVWLKDPFPYFDDIPEDLIFMDDGARTPRYTPFFVNSGFYYVKRNGRTLYMFETMLKSGAAEIGQTHSHQSVLIKHISEVHHLFAMGVYVLDMDLFPSGQTYHENKKLVQKIQTRQFRPYVFHMCWTDNRENKVVFFKDIGLWYLPEGRQECNDGKRMLQFALSHQQKTASEDRGSLMRDTCCQRKNYWPVS